MERWFWYFLSYSFLGFVLEVLFARAIHSDKPDRKCFCLLPLCPVYGLGMAAILALPAGVLARPPLLFLWGAVLATAAEYGTGLLYETVARVRFWDYSHLPLQLQGRVCLPFSLAWGLLALGTVYGIHPYVSALALAIPEQWLMPAALILAGDGALSLALLRHTGTTESLRWYRALGRYTRRSSARVSWMTFWGK